MSDKKTIHIGLLGAGTVANGVSEILSKNAELIEQRVGRSLRITHVAARTPSKYQGDTQGVDIGTDLNAVASHPNVDVVLELIGGYEPARELVLTAIEHGKHVVTANKALIALHGEEIFAAAQAKGVNVAYEAGVAGGIPIIKSLREGLAGNQVQWLAGIINGTGNFILTEMRDKGRDFDDVLKEAQALGYAEADPTFDVEGIDAAHKLTILASIAFGMPLQFEKCYTEGISKVSPEDVTYAQELGYRIKHLGIAKHTQDGVELRVHPTLIPEKRLLANVDGVMNAVVVKADAAGPTLYYGAGAGAAPTGSAVVADIIDVARTFDAPSAGVNALGYQPNTLQPLNIVPAEGIHSAYYLRTEVKDEAGVMAEVTRILADNGISIEAVIQKEPQDDTGHVTLVMMTNTVVEAKLNESITKIEHLNEVVGDVVRIRVEHLS